MVYRTVLLIAFVLMAVGCDTTKAHPFRPAKINHLVFFSLETPSDRNELIEDCDKKLSTIRGVVSYWCGEHGDFGRSTVDGNYDIGFYVGFNSKEDYDYYLNHPDHIAVVEKWKPRWKWIKIHDVVDESP